MKKAFSDSSSPQHSSSLYSFRWKIPKFGKMKILQFVAFVDLCICNKKSNNYVREYCRKNIHLILQCLIIKRTSQNPQSCNVCNAKTNETNNTELVKAQKSENLTKKEIQFPFREQLSLSFDL